MILLANANNCNNGRSGAYSCGGRDGCFLGGFLGEYHSRANYCTIPTSIQINFSTYWVNEADDKHWIIARVTSTLDPTPNH